MPKLITTITLDISLVLVIVNSSSSSRSKCLFSSSSSSFLSLTPLPLNPKFQDSFLKIIEILLILVDHFLKWYIHLLKSPYSYMPSLRDNFDCKTCFITYLYFFFTIFYSRVCKEPISSSTVNLSISLDSSIATTT